MGNKNAGATYDFAKDYKRLPAKKRAGLIRAAMSLLERQKEDAKMLGDVALPAGNARN